MAHSKYYYDFDRNRSIDDATPSEWDRASRQAYDTCEDIGFPQPEQLDMIDDTSYNVPSASVDYKFREDELITEFKNYIDSTYGAHYGQGGLQSSEVIIDRGHGMGFFSGNVDKYNGRYGKKGIPEDHRKDIMKIIHYGFLMLFEHDRIHGNNSR